MKIDILTLFPESYEKVFSSSIMKRAIEKKLVSINIHNFRDYSTDPHHKVDDTPYGGGSGMVIMAQPIFDAVEDLKTDDTTVVLLSPRGSVYNQSMAYSLSLKKHLIIICGHYEGIDERINEIVDVTISIGDYVLTGGEIPSMVLTDSIVRLIPNVIRSSSLVEESFNDNLLDYPVYTKPREFRNLLVPDVLLSGDHKKIEEYRYQERLRITKEKRPDLLER